MINSKFKMNLTTELHMSRCSDGSIRLEITDEDSSFLIAEILLNDAQFTDLLTNRTVSSAITEYYANPNIGKTMETKTVKIPYNNMKQGTSDMRECYDEVEKLYPGWAADRGEKFNHYKYNSKEGTYTVIIRRYV